MAPYEVLYGRPCQSPICWMEVGKRSTTGPDLIRDAFEGGFDTETSSHGLEPIEELHRQTTTT